MSVPAINANTRLYYGEALYVYVGSDSWLAMPDRRYLNYGTNLENITISMNSSTKTTGWNIMPLTQNASMNQTLYAFTFNKTYPANLSQWVNVSLSSYFNASSGKYISCKTGWRYCSGTSLPVENITLNYGAAVWVATDRIASSYVINITRVGS